MKKFTKVLSYLLVAACASCLTLLAVRHQYAGLSRTAKLAELESIIDRYFVDEVDFTAVQDAAADAMVTALGDRWSYYIPASEYESFREASQNAYVGVGITIQEMEDGSGFEITSVEPSGPAMKAGLQTGDLILQIEGQSCVGLSASEARELVRGKEGTEVSMTVLRGEEELTFSVERKRIETPVATYEMLESGYGLIRIENFETKCASETIAAIDALTEQGAKGLIFDVRFNPGGYRDELVKVLDYLLPEGKLFITEDHDGKTETAYSDAECLEMPMAVLVNGDSYSAAEFFAAALQEYGWATVVGQQTCGKGYFQYTFRLSDGSAVGISSGRYYTPNGVNLAGIGVTPDVEVEVTQEEYRSIYSGIMTSEDDPQLQAAVSVLNSAQ